VTLDRAHCTFGDVGEVGLDHAVDDLAAGLVVEGEVEGGALGPVAGDEFEGDHHVVVD